MWDERKEFKNYYFDWLIDCNNSIRDIYLYYYGQKGY